MSKIDWQSYLDGSLSPELREEAERVLANDPSERTRLENMKSFVSEIRRQGLMQEVPLAKLHRCIPAKSRYVWPRLVAPALAATVILVVSGVLYFRPASPAIVREAPAEGISVSDFATAATWMRERNGIETRPILLTSAKLVGSERSDHGGCYCVRCDQEIVHLGYIAKMNPDKSLKLVTEDGRQFLVGDNMVCFQACGVYWIAHGGSDQVRWRVAKEAAAQLQS